MPPEARRQCTEIHLRAPAALFLLLCFAPAAWAHDFWIEPREFRPLPGTAVGLRLFVGQDFTGDAVPYFPQKFERYIVASRAGVISIPGVLGDDPAGTVVPAASGLHVVGLQTKPEKVQFETAQEFERYLEKEGLERNLGLHRRRFKSGKPIEEAYFRCAKSLIAAGAAGDDADRVLGFPLELIAETNPYSTRTLRLRLLYRDRPLSGALVVAFRKSEPAAKLRGRTDADGRIEFILPRSGIWLVTSVHMIPAPLLSRADWNSAWASLTFERP